MLSDDEREKLFGCFDAATLENTRDEALVAVFLSTGLRFPAVLNMPDDLDRVTGEFHVVEKGGKVLPVRMSPAALKLVKAYLRVRPRTESGRLWLTEAGEPLSYWGGQSVFQRIKKRSGVTRMHAHLLRHTFAQGALTKGAERAAVQDMLGHTTDVMTRRYTGAIRQQTAAARMPQYSLV
jgi:site-specific recombinase XerD